MSKNTSSSDFRKIDVDRFDEDNFVDDAPVADDAQADVESRANRVREMLNSKNTGEALKLCIQNPPYGASDAVKDQNCETVMAVLTATKSDDITTGVGSLSPTELDVLMKYVYRGMGHPEAPYSQSLLNWHAAIIKAGGQGTILRVMTDRYAL
eukprot:m.9978 g.9978  ORF g.9978 m.9978 type:complete len:153 (+) comp4173_c0_seq1:48-506(+)